MSEINENDTEVLCFGCFETWSSEHECQSPRTLPKAEVKTSVERVWRGLRLHLKNPPAPEPLPVFDLDPTPPPFREQEKPLTPEALVTQNRNDASSRSKEVALALARNRRALEREARFIHETKTKYPTIIRWGRVLLTASILVAACALLGLRGCRGQEREAETIVWGR